MLRFPFLLVCAKEGWRKKREHCVLSLLRFRSQNLTVSGQRSSLCCSRRLDPALASSLLTLLSSAILIWPLKDVFFLHKHTKMQMPCFFLPLRSEHIHPWALANVGQVPHTFWFSGFDVRILTSGATATESPTNHNFGTTSDKHVIAVFPHTSPSEAPRFYPYDRFLHTPITLWHSKCEN